MGGRHRRRTGSGAADDWQKIGDPYERALELAATQRPRSPAWRRSTCSTAWAPSRPPGRSAARLRELGVTRIPRGRLRATRENPAGLTERQVDVLALLATGLTNAEIAERLVVSTRTVDHHVSAILTRLDVASRRDAARRAAELGLVVGGRLDRFGLDR